MVHFLTVWERQETIILDIRIAHFLSLPVLYRTGKKIYGVDMLTAVPLPHMGQYAFRWTTSLPL